MKKVFAIALLLSVSLTASFRTGAVEKKKDGTIRLLYWNIQNGMWDGQGDNYERFITRRPAAARANRKMRIISPPDGRK